MQIYFAADFRFAPLLSGWPCQPRIARAMLMPPMTRILLRCRDWCSLRFISF
jgi:hypothetical protein